jgi:hypothetical protein
MRHSQDIGKRERLERAAARSEKKINYLRKIKCAANGHYPRHGIAPGLFLKGQGLVPPPESHPTRTVVICKCGGFRKEIPRGVNEVSMGTF